MKTKAPFVSGMYRAAEDAQLRTPGRIQDVKLRPRRYRRYAQTADQLATGPAESRRRIADSLEFKPNAERYVVDVASGQYVLSLPPVVADERRDRFIYRRS